MKIYKDENFDTIAECECGWSAKNYDPSEITWAVAHHNNYVCTLPNAPRSNHKRYSLERKHPRYAKAKSKGKTV